MAALSNDSVSRTETPPPVDDGSFPDSQILPLATGLIAASAKKPKSTPERFIVRPLPDTPSKPINLRVTPKWWERTHRLLNHMSIANQDDIVSEADLSKIQELADVLISEKNPTELLIFLKLLSEFIFFNTKGIFFKVLAALRSVCPDINLFFRDIDSDETDEGPGLTPFAIDSIFKFFEDEFHYPALLSSLPLSALSASVEEIMLSSSPDSIRGWVVFNDLVKIEDDPHVVPIFVQKISGKIHLFIFDSLGHDVATKRISASLEELINHFGTIDVKDKLAIYSYEIKRQNSSNGCSTFAILDLKNLLERQINGAGSIVEFYDCQIEAHRPRLMIRELKDDCDLPVYETDILPPEMMKVTQSFTKIREYERKPPVMSAELIPSFERLKCSGDTYTQTQDISTLRERVDEIRRVAPNGSDINLYVEQKRLSDIVYLLGRSFNLIEEANLVRRRACKSLFPHDEDETELKMG